MKGLDEEIRKASDVTGNAFRCGFLVGGSSQGDIATNTFFLIHIIVVGNG